MEKGLVFCVVIYCEEWEQPEFMYTDEKKALETLGKYQKTGNVVMFDHERGRRFLLQPQYVFVFKEYSKLYRDVDTEKPVRGKSYGIQKMSRDNRVRTLN